MTKLTNIIEREVAVEVIVRGPSAQACKDALEDIRHAVQVSIKPRYLRREYGVEVTVGEAYLDSPLS